MRMRTGPDNPTTPPPNGFDGIIKKNRSSLINGGGPSLKDVITLLSFIVLLVFVIAQWRELSRLRKLDPTNGMMSLISSSEEGQDDGLEDAPVTTVKTTILNDDVSPSNNDNNNNADDASILSESTPILTEQQQIVEQPSSSNNNNAGNKPNQPKSTVLIITGTHLSPQLLREHHLIPPIQDPLCTELATNLHGLWGAWEIFRYVKYKSLVRSSIKKLVERGVSCILAGSGNMIWTFPMTWNSICDSRTQKMLQTKSYIREETKVYVNWALIRPDLVTFHNLALVEGMEPKFLVSIGRDFETAAFTKEPCPRFNVMMEKRDVYRQRLLLVMLSDIQHQLGRVRKNSWVVEICDNRNALLSTNTNNNNNHLLKDFISREEELGKCPPAKSLKTTDKNHMASMSMMRIFAMNENVWQRFPKTIFQGPRLIFVAGLEGVGHHVFAILGKKHTTRPLYEALTDHLCDSTWDDDSANKYIPARQRLVQAMIQLRTDPSLLPRDGSKVFFLNTVFVERDVNMYSYPWGGPRCYLKRYARVVCNIDIIELAKAAEEAGIDFRVVLLKRAIGAAVVSASLHRPFGTLVSETRMLALSWSLLKEGIETIDSKFTIEVTYEDLINHPKESSAKLAEHFGIPNGHALHVHMENTLLESSVEHPVGDGSKWKEEVDMDQLQFMSDILGL
jgi:hypothetical protein